MDLVNKFNFKNIGTIDVSNIKDIVLKFTKEDWNEFTFRQDKLSTHIDTFSIPLIFDTSFSTVKPVYQKWYSQVEDELNKIHDICRNVYSDGYIIRALFVNLPAGKSIPSHKDHGMSLLISNRIHIPIITNDGVIFMVGGESINMKEGEMWEINNGEKIHSVDNKSGHDRIHLIIDWTQTREMIKAM